MVVATYEQPLKKLLTLVGTALFCVFSGELATAGEQAG